MYFQDTHETHEILTPTDDTPAVESSYYLLS